MIHNYLKSAYRNFLRNKISSAITIIGLTSGIVVCIVISLYVNKELSFDNFHQNKNNIYRVANKVFKGGVLESQNAKVFSAYGPALKEEYPEVINYCRIRPYERGFNKEASIQYADRNYKLGNVFYADSTLFSVFSFDMKINNSEVQLRDVNTAIISESTANMFFSEENPVGKMVTINGWQKVEITGVFSDLPDNSHLQFDLLVSYTSVEKNSPKYQQRKWDHPWHKAYTYLLLNPQSDSNHFADHLPAFIKKHKPQLAAKQEAETLFLQPLKKIHLHSNLLMEAEKNGDASQVIILSCLAILIMVIAWLNYLNLSLSMAIDKLKDLSIRKILGIKKINIINQAVIDGLVMFVISCALALVIITLAKGTLNQILDFAILEAVKNNVLFLGILLLCLATLSCLINIYPSIMSASINSARNIFSNSNKLGNERFKKMLVLFQFATFIILVVGALSISKQFSYIKQKDLGVNIDNTLIVESIPFNPNDSEARDKINAFKAELSKQKAIESITSSTQVLGQETNFAMPVNRLSRMVKNPPELFMLGTDYNFIQEYDVVLTHGRAFSKELDKNMFGAVLINESAAHSLKYDNMEQCLNDSIDAAGIQTKIVGVFKDFHQLGFKTKVPPMLISLAPNVGYFAIKYSDINRSELLKFIQTEYESFFPQVPFEYFHLDDFYFNQYKSDFQFGKMVNAFMIISMIISCIALLGFSYYNINKRTKEIGIRKVNGAKVSEILRLLNQDTIKLIVIAFVISVPIAWYGLNKWLENFAYKTNIVW